MTNAKIEIGGFIIAPEKIVDHIGFMAAGVYGLIWRYEQMSDEACRAAQATMAARLGITRQTLRAHIQKLIEGGYIVDCTPDARNRPHVYRTTDKLRLSLAMVDRSDAVEQGGVKNFDTTKRDSDAEVSKIFTPRCKNFYHESESLIDSRAKNARISPDGEMCALKRDQKSKASHKTIPKPNSKKASRSFWDPPILRELAERFAKARGLKLPYMASPADFRAGARRWREPLKAIYNLCDQDAERAGRLIEITVERMVRDGLTFSMPDQIVKTAESIAADMASGSNRLADLPLSEAERLKMLFQEIEKRSDVTDYVR